MRILFLDLDTLRPDHLGCYGYHRNTSPNIDSIAKQGVRFENYYCSDAPCLPSRASLISGRFGIHTGAVGHGGTAADMRLFGSERGFKDRLASESMINIFRRAGMKTASISPFAERHSSFWFYAGFNEMYNTGKGGMESAEEITPVALDWIERNAHEDNWFLHINYWDAHTPYRAPHDFGNPFENDPLPEWLNEDILEHHKKAVGPHSAKELSMYDSSTSPSYPRALGELKDMSDLKAYIDGYDCGIKYLDEHIGMLFAALKKKGVFEDMAVIITSDHGENMGELSIYGEHATADNVTPKIPMIVKWKGMKTDIADSSLHYSLDFLPTLCELLDVESCDSWDGHSYYNTLRDGSDAGRDSLVLSQCAHVLQRSVRYKDYIYMRTYHDGYHLFPDEMLFNVKEDPHETKNLIDEEADIAGICARILENWHSDMMKTSDSPFDPLWTVYQEGGPFHAKGHLRQYIKQLETTGRQWAIPILKEKHNKELR